MKIRGFLKNNRLIFFSFFLPVFILILAFVVGGIYPFGDNQIAVIDMYHQYVPFLSELQYKLHNGGSLFYTWNGAGGCNFWNLISYYGASPLNLILFLFPQKLVMEGVTFILVLKIGFAGSFMAIFLRYYDRQCRGDISLGRAALCSEVQRDKSGSIAIVGFSTMYALCSYVMAYYWCVMWIDGVMLLPLCVLGLHKIIDGGSALLYTVSLAIIVFVNYYIAIMICIFIMVYYPILYFIKVKDGGLRRCLVTTGKAVGFSFLGIALASPMLIPTYLSMQSTFYISSEMPDNWLFYRDALDIINQLLPNAQLTFREGAPNLYCGLIVVILLILYIINKTIPFREKALNMAFLIFMFFSLNINKLDFIWHGFHFPNQLPFRYTFVISFVLIGIAYRAFLKIGQVKVNAAWGILAGGIGYYLIAQKLFDKEISDMGLFVYGGIVWLLMYIVVIVIYKKDKIRKNAFVFLIVILIASEAFCNVCTSFDKIGTSYRDVYFANSQDIMSLAKETRKEFVRTETGDYDILNNPAMYHYRGLSQFSSSLNANATGIMEKIGLEGEPGKNRYNYNQTCPVTNAMLNLKYLISKNLPIEDKDFKLIDSKGYSKLYESKYPLSMGYMTGNEIWTWNTESLNPFENLDDYVRAATGNSVEGVFHDIGNPDISAYNAAVSVDGDGLMTGAINSETSKSKVVLTYKAQETRKYYVYVEATNASDITLKKGNKVDNISIRNDCGSIVNIGTIDAGREFKIVINYSPDKIGTIRSHVCYMDEDAWNGAYEVLSRNTFDIKDYGDTYVNGKIHADEDGVFVTSVLYEKGWEMKVDGEKREINQLVGEGFIATPLSKGDHYIELTFRPPGFMVGVIVMLISIGLLIAYYFFQRKRRSSSLEGISLRGI